jgi:hypothetical protein
MPSKDQTFCDNHFIVSEEIKMQDMIRDFLTDQMETLGKLKKWEVYELDENSDGVCLIPVNRNEKAYPVPYSIRSPHGLQISFVFIVNEDSLQVWKDWFNNMAENAQGLGNDMKSGFDDPAYVAAQKEYMDSADYWSGLLVAYETKNFQVFQQAALNKDDAFVKKYEMVTKNYQSHMDYWTKKGSDLSQATMASSGQKMTQLQDDSHLKIDAFRNATMIRVTFDFNNNRAVAAETDDIHLVKQLSVSSTSLAQLYHNNKTSDNRIYSLNVFNRSTDLALLLLGKWNIDADKYGKYHAVYAMDKKNTDKFTIKQVTCDKIQTISVHIEGRPYYIESFLKSLQIEKLNSIITK